MTVISTANNTSALVAELGGQAPQAVDYMIGIGLVKDSDAVFFQYVGDDEKQALMEPSGRPCTRIGQVFLTDISIIDNVYEERGFSGSKLNVFLQTQSGVSLMLTSGLSTIWSQCLITALVELQMAGALDHLITIDTWKGTSKMRPCFAAVRDGAAKVSNDDTYEALMKARANKDRALVETIMRDSVENIAAALSMASPEVVEVTEEIDEAVQF